MEQFVITFDEIRALLVEQQYAEKDIEELEKAFEFAKKLHSGQYRVSEEPYIIHPMEVVKILIALRADKNTLMAGFLHDLLEDTDATEEEILAAAKASHAHNFIKRLPQGYDTMITEDGGNLSQGQQQLLCITRVMLCLPPMLILDEATSSIDTRTELKIQNAFATMMKGRTSFIVAHRLSTIKEADVILVMKDGNIIEQGNHKQLLAQNGFYAKLYNSQFSR